MSVWVVWVFGVCALIVLKINVVSLPDGSDIILNLNENIIIKNQLLIVRVQSRYLYYIHILKGV